MQRNDFVAEFYALRRNKGSLMSEEAIKRKIHEQADPEKELHICIGELAELALELTRYQHGEMNSDDFLQELSHVQRAAWSPDGRFQFSDIGSRRLPPRGISFLNRSMTFMPQR